MAALTRGPGMRILTVNSGSSSLKLSALDDGGTVAAQTVAASAGHIDEAALQAFIDLHGPFDAVGHRVVHGGTSYVDPVRVDAAVRRRLEALTDLAPLHQPKSLRGLDVVTRLLPDTPAVACFDTAFHARLPAAAATYAIPSEWRKRWPLRRFGFHGLSHAYASRRAAELLGTEVERLRIVTCHLGAGGSLAAVRHGVSVDTTMGFTPLEGLTMATRSGSVDPGLVLWLLDHVGMPSSELAATLEHRSGLVGLAGTDDMAAVLDAEIRGEPDAVLAVGVYLHRLSAGIAAMTAALGGLDAVVFTGGVGERAPSLRLRAVEAVPFLGLTVEPRTNADDGADRDISGPGATARTLVVHAREDLEIARQVRTVVS